MCSCSTRHIFKVIVEFIVPNEISCVFFLFQMFAFLRKKIVFNNEGARIRWRYSPETARATMTTATTTGKSTDRKRFPLPRTAFPETSYPNSFRSAVALAGTLYAFAPLARTLECTHAAVDLKIIFPFSLQNTGSIAYWHNARIADKSRRVERFSAADQSRVRATAVRPPVSFYTNRFSLRSR